MQQHATIIGKHTAVTATKLNVNSRITCHTVYTQMLIHLVEKLLVTSGNYQDALFPGSPVLSRWQPCKISTPGTKSVKISTQGKAYSVNSPRVNPPSPSWGFMHFISAGPRVRPRPTTEICQGIQE